MRIGLPIWVQDADTSNPETVARLREREAELIEELASGGYTKRSYEAADKHELNAIRKLLKKSEKN